MIFELKKFNIFSSPEYKFEEPSLNISVVILLNELKAELEAILSL
jgi:hypothetical protein